ncbi:hypothetical protein FNV43_RR11158 [Rhamnella rubrinervis]|uniref:Uncharacterized protein n=1 Tax=Rhamnella rubrinervis TaxID=2594499 RepID=A0A8K0H5R5_9ROSA|nr:hypothetical protein FNV43_RR11158 [Rhamnella rubrinervis]
MKELEEEDSYRCSSFDASLRNTKKKLKEDPEDIDFEMSYVRLKDKDYQVSDEDEDTKTPPHYHSEEFHGDSSSEE